MRLKDPLLNFFVNIYETNQRTGYFGDAESKEQRLLEALKEINSFA